MNPSIKKILYFPITKILIGIGLCFSLFVAIQNFVSKPFFYYLFPDKSIADPMIHCVSVLVLLFGYYYLFRFYDKRKITELSLKYLHNEMFGGFILGFLAITFTIFLLYILGYYEVLDITTEHYSLRLFCLLIVAALIEDLFTRGLIIRVCENWLGTNLAIVVGMLLETWHMFNPNANLFSLFTDLVWGFTMAMLFIYTKRIWLPFFFHLGWNFAQPFYGSNLTGLSDMGSIIQSKFSGPQLFTGGLVGVENSIFTVITLLSIGIILYYLSKKEGKIVKGSIWNKNLKENFIEDEN
ncbi:CPBP family intramembrane glutamic endopeptidase [Flavobacterium sp.]|uniref:CPBP family intramembrane glutamic endopeptidase n=1 Tax=Flavobacterium sp. TaxID=239 RepID=UPI003D6C3257